MSGLQFPQTFGAGNGVQFAPIPEDQHPGVCIGVIDLGTHRESYKGGPEKSVRKIKLQFELPTVTREDGKSAVIARKLNVTFGENASLTKVLTSWLGKSWQDELKGKSFEALIGRSALINVEHSPPDANGRVWANIAGIGKLPKGMPAPEPTRDTCFIDLSAGVLPEKLSLRDAEEIRRSAEYRAQKFDDRAPRPDAATVLAVPPVSTSHQPPVESDDDIPF